MLSARAGTNPGRIGRSRYDSEGDRRFLSPREWEAASPLSPPAGSHRVRAIIVYPMNALINSQAKALETYTKNNPNTQIRFDRYTGQEQDR